MLDIRNEDNYLTIHHFKKHKWTADEYKSYFSKVSNQNRIPELALIKESKLEILIPINMSFEFDYLKWSVTYSKTSSGQRIFGLLNTE